MRFEEFVVVIKGFTRLLFNQNRFAQRIQN